MRVLLSTTLGHNPGDDLIAMGVMNLLRHGLKLPDLEVVLYNRNPDLQVTTDFGASRQPLSNPIGNYITNPVDLKGLGIDAVVLGGSPEWFGGPMEPLYKALIASPEVPLWALGVGLGNPHSRLSETDLGALRRPSTRIVTRSHETTSFLLRNGIPGAALPCPALFSSMTTYAAERRGTLRVLQKPGGGWHEVSDQVLVGMDQIAGDVLCEHVRELQFFRARGYNPRYAGSGGEVLKQVNQYEKVISTRLHGAIGSLSMGVPAVCVSGKDYRIETCAVMLREVMPSVQNVGEAREALVASPKEIAAFKWDSWNTWIKYLKEIGIREC